VPIEDALLDMELQNNDSAPPPKPAIDTLPQYKSYRAEFDGKYQQYQAAHEWLLSNSNMFAELGRQLEAADAAQKAAVKQKIKVLFSERKSKVDETVTKYKILHLELRDIKDKVAEYVRRCRIK